MLHWNSWWPGSIPAADRAIDEPAPWTPAGLFTLQARWWEQVFEANRAWWTLVTVTMPPALPPPGVIEPPPDVEPTQDLDLPTAPSEPKRVAARRPRAKRPSGG